MTHYSNSPLKEVMFKLDFDKIELYPEKLKEFYEKIKENYKFQEIIEASRNIINVDNITGNATNEQQIEISYKFSNENKTNEIFFTNDFILIIYKEYQSHNMLYDDVSNIASILSDFGVEILKKIELRYLNQINFPNKNDITNFIDENLIGLYDFSKDRDVSRTMGHITFKESEYSLAFNFGFWNEDYPSRILRRNYILDFDATSIVPFSVSEIKLTEIIEDYHNEILRMFEKSITSSYKEKIK